MPAVAGYEPGEVPPVPLIVLPDLSMLDASLAGFALDVDAAVGDVPGVTVTPTRCDATGAVEVGRGVLLATSWPAGSRPAASRARASAWRWSASSPGGTAARSTCAHGLVKARARACGSRRATARQGSGSGRRGDRMAG